LQASSPYNPGGDPSYDEEGLKRDNQGKEKKDLMEIYPTGWETSGVILGTTSSASYITTKVYNHQIALN